MIVAVGRGVYDAGIAAAGENQAAQRLQPLEGTQRQLVIIKAELQHEIAARLTVARRKRARFAIQIVTRQILDRAVSAGQPKRVNIFGQVVEFERERRGRQLRGILHTIGNVAATGHLAEQHRAQRLKRERIELIVERETNRE